MIIEMESVIDPIYISFHIGVCLVAFTHTLTFQVHSILQTFMILFSTAHPPDNRV